MVIDKIIDHCNRLHQDSISCVHHSIDSEYHLLHWFSSILYWLADCPFILKTPRFQMKVVPCRPNCLLHSHLSKWAFTYFIEASISCFISLRATTKTAISRHWVCIRHVCKNTLRYQRVINSWNLLRRGRFIGDTFYILLRNSVVADASVTHGRAPRVIKLGCSSVLTHKQVYRWELKIFLFELKLLCSIVSTWIAHYVNEHDFDSHQSIFKTIDSASRIKCHKFCRTRQKCGKTLVRVCCESEYMWNVALPSFAFDTLLIHDLRVYWISSFVVEFAGKHTKKKKQ